MQHAPSHLPAYKVSFPGHIFIFFSTSHFAPHHTHTTVFTSAWFALITPRVGHPRGNAPHWWVVRWVGLLAPPAISELITGPCSMLSLCSYNKFPDLEAYKEKMLILARIVEILVCGPCYCGPSAAQDSMAKEQTRKAYCGAEPPSSTVT